MQMTGREIPLLGNRFSKAPDALNYEVTHKYIDFQYLIIGQKLRMVIENKVKSIEDKNQLLFDDLYYAKFMIKG